MDREGIYISRTKGSYLLLQYIKWRWRGICGIERKSQRIFGREYPQLVNTLPTRKWPVWEFNSPYVPLAHFEWLFVDGVFLFTPTCSKKENLPHNYSHVFWWNHKLRGFFSFDNRMSGPTCNWINGQVGLGFKKLSWVGEWVIEPIINGF